MHLSSKPSLPFVLALLMIPACGGDDGTAATVDASAAPDGGATADAAVGPDAAPVAMTLTSPSLSMGASFLAEHTCTGDDVSPQLAWTPKPPGTLSYAVALVDESNDLTHWVIYDIPGDATGLPADVEQVYAPGDVAGAHQTASFSSSDRGYRGPCPPSEHTYTFTVYALDVATLPGADQDTTRAEALALITAHTLGSGSLTGTYEQP